MELFIFLALTRMHELKESKKNVKNSSQSSLLTRAYELKEPSRKSLILNASFREPVTFILYRLVQITRFALSTHTVFDSHLNLCSVQAYEIPLLGIPIAGFPSFVCFVVVRELQHFLTQSQDFFVIIMKLLIFFVIGRSKNV